MAEETFSNTLLSAGQICTASPPTMVAPKVLAIVFRLRIAELVSSSPSLYFSSFSPRPGWDFFNPSISAVVVLRIMASNTEQRAEITMVKAIAKINAKVIVRVLLESCRVDMC